jgi:putative acetyltransferase
MSITVRAEREDDRKAVRRVNEAAFPTHAEADLADRLRADGDFLLSLVAVRNDEVIGHAGFPRLTIAGADGTIDVAGLAPVAVIPAVQRQGAGSALILQGIDLLHRRGPALLFVFGDPAYYRRFGFEASLAAMFTSVYAGPYLQALRLAGKPPISGVLRYPKAFEALA